MLKRSLSFLILGAFLTNAFSQIASDSSLREARAALDKGDFSSSIRTYEELRRRPATAQKASEGLALAYLMSKQFAKCISVSQESAVAWPRNPVFPHMHGLALFQQGQLRAADEKLKAAQALAPTDTSIAYDLGLVLMAQHNYDAAAKQFETIVGKRQDSATLRVLLGRAYLNSNRSVLALEQFKSALKLDPKLPLAHYHLGFALESLGRLSEAFTEFATESALQPHNPEVLYRLGHVQLEKGNTADAIDKLQNAAEGGQSDAYYDLGKALLTEGRTEEALVALRSAVSAHPDSSSSYFQLSRAFEKLGKKNEASTALKRFYELRKLEQQSGGMATGRIPQ